MTPIRQACAQTRALPDGGRARRFPTAWTILPLLLATGGALAEAPADYRACVAMVETNPQAALAAAEAWAGGGRAAAHCAALAESRLGRWSQAATRLDRLAASAPSPEPAAELLAQAGNAWLSAERPMEAQVALAKALALRADDPELRIDHARALAAQAQWQKAIAELDLALALDPVRTDVLVLRAAARRGLGALALARADIDLALERDAENADALLERGILRSMAGEETGARGDWITVIRIDPTGPSGRAAQANLAAMAQPGPTP